MVIDYISAVAVIRINDIELKQCIPTLDMLVYATTNNSPFTCAHSL